MWKIRKVDLLVMLKQSKRNRGITQYKIYDFPEQLRKDEVKFI